MRITYEKSVPKTVLTIMRSAAKFAGLWGQDLKIKLIHAGALRSPDNKFAFGAYVPVMSTIFIATKELAKVGKEALLEVLFHEIVHYEQRKQGKKFNESVATRKARRLVKEFLENE